MKDHETSELEMKKRTLRGLAAHENKQGQETRAKTFATLLCCSLIAGVLLVKASVGKYDSSGPCVLDEHYTETTSTEGEAKDVSYRFTYSFIVKRTEYRGTDTTLRLPASRFTTVYYMAANPHANSLRPTRFNGYALVGAGIAFLFGLIAYAKLPKYRIRRVPRGKYDASGHVAFAFFVQAGVMGVLLAWIVSSVLNVPATGYAPLLLGTLSAVLLTLGIYWGQWDNIEAHSSKFCSGIMNLSILYIPAVIIFYANYRALMRLLGRSDYDKHSGARLSSS